MQIVFRFTDICIQWEEVVVPAVQTYLYQTCSVRGTVPGLQPTRNSFTDCLPEILRRSKQ
jgi:hypothetical protein